MYWIATESGILLKYQNSEAVPCLGRLQMAFHIGADMFSHGWFHGTSLVDEVALEQTFLIFTSAFLCHISYLHCFASYSLLYYGNRTYAAAHTRHYHVPLLKLGT